MSESKFTQRIDVLEMFIALHEEHMNKLDKLITKLEKTQSVHIVNRKENKQ